MDSCVALMLVRVLNSAWVSLYNPKSLEYEYYLNVFVAFYKKRLLKYASSLVAVRRMIALTFFAILIFSDKSIFLSKYCCMH